MSTQPDRKMEPVLPGPDLDGSAPSTGNAERAKTIPRISIQAFCEDKNTAEALEAASFDRRLSKAHVTVQMGGIQSALAFYESAPTPNLILLESVQARDAMLSELDRLAEVCDPGSKVIIIGHVNDVALYRELIRLGISEYVVAPVTPISVMEAISNLYNNPETDPIGNITAFIGSKGGVGSSTVCHNCAWTISESLRADVAILDFDLPFGTAGLDFDQDPVQGIADALNSPERLDEVLLDRLLAKCSDHLSLFAAPGTLDREYDLNVSACDTVLDVVRQNVPHIAVDIPHIWTGWAKKILLQSDEIVITATPDLASLRNTKNLVELLKAQRNNDNPPHIVLNQVNMPKRPEIDVKDFTAAVELEPSAIIEFDAELFGTAANNAQMIEEVSANAKAAEQFKTLSYKLAHRTEMKQESANSLLGPLFSRFGLKKAGS